MKKIINGGGWVIKPTNRTLIKKDIENYPQLLTVKN